MNAVTITTHDYGDYTRHLTEADLFNYLVQEFDSDINWTLAEFLGIAFGLQMAWTKMSAGQVSVYIDPVRKAIFTLGRLSPELRAKDSPHLREAIEAAKKLTIEEAQKQ